MKIAIIGLLFLALSLPAATFNVRDFGATGDGHTLDTAAIQKALNACENTGGTVEFPSGTYLSQPLTIRTRSIIQLDDGATLQAVTNQSDFMKQPGDWLKAKTSGDFVPFIKGSGLTNVVFTGSGTIDGNGSVWWGEAEKARQIKPGYTLPRPNLIVMDHCADVRLENLTLQNSPKYHFVPGECEGVVVSNVTILAPAGAANTDAIDPGNCENVLITRCRIDVGDDNIAIKSVRKVVGREFGCENIVVSHCTFLHGHGMSIGSETTGGVHNVTVSDCTFENTDNGIRIKSQPGKGGPVENIVCDHITMKNVNPAITFTCYYANNSSGDAHAAAINQTTQPSENIPAYRHIIIRNLTATCPFEAGDIVGLPQICISDIVFENVSITATKSFNVRNAKGIQLKNVTVTLPAGKPFKLENAEVAGLDQ